MFGQQNGITFFINLSVEGKSYLLKFLENSRKYVMISVGARDTPEEQCINTLWFNSLNRCRILHASKRLSLYV